jgi:hypothetical protein
VTTRAARSGLDAHLQHVKRGSKPPRSGNGACARYHPGPQQRTAGEGWLRRGAVPFLARGLRGVRRRRRYGHLRRGGIFQGKKTQRGVACAERPLEHPHLRPTEGYKTVDGETMPGL